MAARVLAERYELDQRIDSGAMGEVWSATDLQTGRSVAVKLAQRWAAIDPELATRFARESELLGRIKSPFVCALLDAGQDGTTPYMVLERLEGETLEARLEREGHLSVLEAGRIGEEALQALAAAHRAGVVHRDLSPSNVFLHRTPEGETITKLLDFGVARDLAPGDGPRTGKNVTMGSLPYVAPEQLGESAKAGPRADLYAFGTLAFRALSGRLPYGDAAGTRLAVMKIEHDAPTLDEATGETWPAALRLFLIKALARAPSRRHSSAEVALAAWREAVRGKGPRLAMPEAPRGATVTLGPDARAARSGGEPAPRGKGR